jgi:flagellar basal-body rod protein FlgB
MFNQITSLSKTGQILTTLGRQQRIIGENIANVDTPGYTKKQLNFADFLSPGMNNLEKKMNEKFGTSIAGVENTGETVNIADEIVDMQKNSLMYSVAVRRMSSAITEMKSVINLGR